MTRVRFQYADGSEWEDAVARAAESPDRGVVRMWAVHEDGRRIEFVYDDYYYVARVPGGWKFGSGTPCREFILLDDENETVVDVPVRIPAGSVVRLGKTVPYDTAVAMGLIEPDADTHVKIRPVTVLPSGGGD